MGIAAVKGSTTAVCFRFGAIDVLSFASTHDVGWHDGREDERLVLAAAAAAARHAP